MLSQRTKYFLRTFGCRVNQAETGELRALLDAAGCSPADQLSQADLCIVNTCTVTRDADREALKFLRRVSRDIPQARLFVIGCMADRSPEDIRQAAPKAQIVVNDDKDALPQVLGLSVHEPRQAAPDRARAFLKVQDGCDAACSYCVVPKVRPRLRSLAPATVEAKVRGLVAADVPEIVLCGIRLGRYHHEDVKFLGLIERLLCIPGAFRLRLSSLELHEADDALAGLIDSSRGRLCPHLHLPLQSGSDVTLRRMNRPYGAAAFARRLAALRRLAPCLAFFTDIITGFPGETESEHRESLAFVKSQDFCGLHIFRFSPRPGTAAAAMHDPVAPAAARERLASWRELDCELRQAHWRRAAGQSRVVVALRGGSRALTEDFLEVRLEQPLSPGLWKVTLRECPNTAIIYNF